MELLEATLTLALAPLHIHLTVLYFLSVCFLIKFLSVISVKNMTVNAPNWQQTDVSSEDDIVDVLCNNIDPNTYYVCGWVEATNVDTPYEGVLRYGSPNGATIISNSTD